MEGRWSPQAWRVVVVSVMTCAGLATGGCESGSTETGAPNAVRTADPVRAFAPLVAIARDEPHRPMSARWFIERSALWIAEDRGCADRKIAVGHALAEQRTDRIDWIYVHGLGRGKSGGRGMNYYRNPYGLDCRLNFDVRVYADQPTRPFDPGPRVDDARPGQGFYLDLSDTARGGPAFVTGDRPVTAPAYGERTDEGDRGVRLTYWMLFGADVPAGDAGHANEGDWERVDVLLRDEGDGRYTPLGAQLGGAGADGPPPATKAWSSVERVGGTHAVVESERSSHELTFARSSGALCEGCVRWPTWEGLADARAEPWYGFGGAWGEPGATDATTGPLGPHGYWPSAAEKDREVFGG